MRCPADRQGQEVRVEAELSRILVSPAFKSSPRCRQFLEFVVTQALAGRYELLKERMIGVEVFGRNPAYETEGDSVVRTRATEVRRRLAQYYSHTHEPVGCLIEIPSGSYIPQFSVPEQVPAALHLAPSLQPESLPPGGPWFGLQGKRGSAILFGLAILLIAVVAAFVAQAIKPRSGVLADPSDKIIQTFWGPAIRDSRAILLCMGSPTTYTYSREVRAAYAREHGVDLTEQPQWVVQPDKQPIPAGSIVPVKGEYIGAGDANVATMLSALFARLDKPAEFRLSEDTSYGEISDAPTVLIGAFSNRWTLANSTSLPFVFVERDGIRRIEERSGAHRTWMLPQLHPDGKTDEDYAIVSRLLDAQTGKFLVTAGGISGFGSRAAGYFLTRPDLMAKIMGNAPANWQQKNIEIVLKTHVVDNAPTAPEVIAIAAW